MISYRFYVLLATIVCGLRPIVNAQSVTWSPAVSVAASSFENQHPRIALNAAGNPVIVWGKSGNNSVYVSRWSGSAFTMPMKMNPTGINAFAASFAGANIAAKGETVYVVYKAQPEDTAGIYIMRSVNGGAAFGTPVRVDNIFPNSSRFPTITTDAAGHPIVAFMKFNSGFTSARWVVSKSMNWGASFMPEVMASSYNGEPVCDCCPGTLLYSGSTATMLYRNNWNDKRTIWMGHSTNAGATFPMGLDIDNTNWTISACPSSGPDGVIIGDSLYSAFMSGNGGTKAYYSKTKISTMQTTGAIPLTGTSTGIAGQNFPRVANDNMTVAMVWPQVENNLPEIAMIFASNIQNGVPLWEKAQATQS